MAEEEAPHSAATSSATPPFVAGDGADADPPVLVAGAVGRASDALPSREYYSFGSAVA